MIGKLKILGCFLVLLTIACNKDDLNGPYSSLDNYFKSQLQPDTFVFNTTEEIVIIGRQGTRLTIPAESLTSDGFSVYEGKVMIRFQEFFSKSDVLLNNIPMNTTSGEWLESGGSFFVDIRDEERRRVWLNNPMQLDFPISDEISDPTNMNLWIGPTEGDITDDIDFGAWEQANPNFPDSSFVQVNTGEQQFSMFSNNWVWINCDYVFESSASRTKVSAKPINFSGDFFDLRTFIVLENINSVLRLDLIENKYESFPLPIGESGHIVMMGLDNGKLYLAIEPFTVEANQHFDLTPERKSEEELKELLKELD